MGAQTCILIGAGMDCGKRRRGCIMGPDAYRTAGLAETLADLGWETEDRGNLPGPAWVENAAEGKVHALRETIEWTRLLTQASEDAMDDGFPIFMGFGGLEPFTQFFVPPGLALEFLARRIQIPLNLFALLHQSVDVFQVQV